MSDRVYWINHIPPPLASCGACWGEGQILRPSKEFYYVACDKCAATGLTPIPICEVISNLRRGDEPTEAAREWLYGEREE